MTARDSAARRRAKQLTAELAAMGSATDRAGMARYGINVERAFGVSVKALRAIARRIGTDHELALALWATGRHEARQWARRSEPWVRRAAVLHAAAPLA